MIYDIKQKLVVVEVRKNNTYFWTVLYLVCIELLILGELYYN
jgi:hypothetical protein